MRHTLVLVLLPVLSAIAGRSPGQDPATLKVTGRGVEGRPAYRQGGVVQFTGVSLGAQVVHFDAEKRVSLPLAVRYNVIEPAPILLTSRMGTEYWNLYDFDAEAMAAMYADQKIDLSAPGSHTARATRGWFGKYYGPLPQSGLVGIRGHGYFLIERPGGEWIDVVDPPPFLDQPSVVRDLTFTLADLSRYELAVSEVQSSWQPGGPFRVRLVVRDGQGRTLPVIGAPLVASAGPWQAPLATEWTPLGEPTGWMRAALPGPVPDQVAISGQVTLATAGAIETRKVAADFSRGTGLVSDDQLKIAEQGYQLPRGKDGVIREIRAVWVGSDDFKTAEGVDRVVARCIQARLNVIIPDIFVRNGFYARSDLIPTAREIREGFDPLESLITKAHAAGLEVHPWFCVTYRDGRFRKWFAEKYGRTVDMFDPQGKVLAEGADVHRPEYRQFIVDLMVGVARDYQVDGIHLDYIRTMGRCHCPDCRKEFAAAHGAGLDAATDDQWVGWQRQAIGDIVERTAAGVRKARPAALMSAAVFSSMPGGASQGQDPAGWAERGWIDLVLPMDYQMQTLQVRSNERRFLDAMDDDNRLVTGLSLYMRTEDGAHSRPPELVLEQIELVRRMGIHGYCLFALNHLSDEQLEALREKANAEPAKPFYRK
ncbi:MAG: glycoside hydrolase family 10 protein [Thermoguttaceae bacterium]